MARTTGSTSRPPGGSGLPGGSSSRSRRSRPAPVKKPFPWGFAAGVTVLALLLVGVLAYSYKNSGSGFKTAADKADSSFKGLLVDKGLKRNHVDGGVKYSRTPPDGGDHNAYPQSCQVYTAQIANEHAVHSLEHGAVWVTYRPDLPADQVKVLADQVTGNDYRLMSPYPGLAQPITLVAWGRELSVSKASDPKVAKFLDTYTNGPQTQEAGAACEGTTKTGTDPTATNPDLSDAANLPVPSANVPSPAKS
jgi:Protein of unknown function (DUF3105)